MKPSDFTTQPMGSVLGKYEAETVAKNIMLILKRTGDEFGSAHRVYPVSDFDGCKIRVILKAWKVDGVGKSPK